MNEDDRLRAAATEYAARETPSVPPPYDDVLRRRRQRVSRRNVAGGTVLTVAVVLTAAATMHLSSSGHSTPGEVAPTISQPPPPTASPGMSSAVATQTASPQPNPAAAWPATAFGHVWSLVSAKRGGTTTTWPVGTVTLVLTPTRWIGDDGCNAHFGETTYDSAGFALTLNDTTAAYCNSALGRAANELFLDAGGKTNAQVSGNEMLLTLARGDQLHLVASSASKPATPQWPGYPGPLPSGYGE